MIKSTEVRIGNKVDLYGTTVTVQIMDFSQGLAIIKGKPIPLTEEWILKFGFKFYDYELDDGELYQSFKIPFKKYEYRITINPDGICEFCVKWRWSEEGVLARIKHVHQLQNLYFALTNKELTLNNNR